MNPVTIEWAPFKIRPGTDEATLLREAEALQQEFIAKQEGFLRRELLKGADGEWIDLLYWTSAEAAHAAMRAAETSPVCQRYFQLLDDPAAGVAHYAVVRSFAAPATPQAVGSGK